MPGAVDLLHGLFYPFAFPKYIFKHQNTVVVLIDIYSDEDLLTFNYETKYWFIIGPINTV